MINLAAKDMEILIELHYTNTILIVGLMVPAAAVILWFYLGVAGLFGIIIMIVILLI